MVKDAIAKAVELVVQGTNTSTLKEATFKRKAQPHNENDLQSIQHGLCKHMF